MGYPSNDTSEQAFEEPDEDTNSLQPTATNSILTDKDITMFTLNASPVSNQTPTITSTFQSQPTGIPTNGKIPNSPTSARLSTASIAGIAVGSVSFIVNNHHFPSESKKESFAPRWT